MSMYNRTFNVYNVAERHALNRIELFHKMVSLYNKNKQLYVIDGEKSYNYKLPIKKLAQVIRQTLWCSDLVRVTTQTIPSEDNDLGVAGSYTSSLSPTKPLKPITLELVLYDNGDGGYWMNVHSIPVMVDEVYDTIEHELRHLTQDTKSAGRAFNAANVDYLDKHYEVDAFAVMATSQIRRHLNRTKESINIALASSSHVVNMYREQANQTTMNRLLKKIYKGVVGEHHKEHNQRESVR